MNPDGSALVGPVTSAAREYPAPVEHLGNRIVFVSNRDGNQEVYTMRTGGEEQTRLTNNLADGGTPPTRPIAAGSLSRPRGWRPTTWSCTS